MQTKEAPNDTPLEFIENPEVVKARLEKIKISLSKLAENHPPVLAYTVVLDAAINYLQDDKNKMFYFPIPWETDTDLPSQPSLIADAKHFCRTNNLAEARIIVGSFAEWRLFCKQNFLCCCGKKSFSPRNLDRLIIPLEIMIHHPINVDREFKTLEIKQLVGIRSTDRNHLEYHYDLRSDSRVNDDISIVRTGSVKIGLPNFQLLEQTENSSKQFDLDYFKRIFIEMCRKTTPHSYMSVGQVPTPA